MTDNSGNVISAKVIKGNKNETNSAALEFAKKLKFTPAEQNGMKIPFRFVIPFPKKNLKRK